RHLRPHGIGIAILPSLNVFTIERHTDERLARAGLPNADLRRDWRLRVNPHVFPFPIIAAPEGSDLAFVFLRALRYKPISIDSRLRRLYAPIKLAIPSLNQADLIAEDIQPLALRYLNEKPQLIVSCAFS